MKFFKIKNTFLSYLTFLRLSLQKKKVKIISFEVAPLFLVEGGIIYLKWEIENFWKVELLPNIGDVSNKKSIALSARIPIRKFTLVAHGYDNIVTKKLQINLNSLKYTSPHLKTSQYKFNINNLVSNNLKKLQIKPPSISINSKFQLSRKIDRSINNKYIPLNILGINKTIPKTFHLQSVSIVKQSIDSTKISFNPKIKFTEQSLIDDIKNTNNIKELESQIDLINK